ncbi:MAG: glucose-6-phosphate isomerase [Candidatus Coatesbacteria bacterium]|nr:glucose-6-phosphate isomerase [Candidatus Coatesbacteria bacterium]
MNENTQALQQVLQFDYANALESAVGKQNGLSEELLSEFAASEGERAANALAETRAAGSLAFADVIDDERAVDEAKSLAQELQGTLENLVMIGIGGSALGNTALHSALLPPLHNLMSADRRKGRPRWFVLDNVDPDVTSALLDTLNLSKTLFVVTSKSGGTPETIANFAIAYKRVIEAIGQSSAASHFVAITDPQEGFLRQFSKQNHFHTLPVPQKLGGRFSVLCAVGLFPAALCGIDVDGFLAGARRMIEACFGARNVMQAPGYLAAMVYFLADKMRGKHINVMFPYSGRLVAFADWFVQLWAESLGKAENRDGETVNVGQTPLPAVGATDQHSQNQLFVEGPADKIITFVDVERFDSEVIIPDDFKDDPKIGYLAGHTLSELIRTEKLGTELALKERSRPTCSITLPRIDAESLGQLLMMFMLATAFAGELYNVNAFDQPGVELGKKITKKRLGG